MYFPVPIHILTSKLNSTWKWANFEKKNYDCSFQLKVLVLGYILPDVYYVKNNISEFSLSLTNTLITYEANFRSISQRINDIWTTKCIAQRLQLMKLQYHTEYEHQPIVNYIKSLVTFDTECLFIWIAHRNNQPNDISLKIDFFVASCSRCENTSPRKKNEFQSF